MHGCANEVHDNKSAIEMRTQTATSRAACCCEKYRQSVATLFTWFTFLIFLARPRIPPMHMIPCWHPLHTCVSVGMPCTQYAHSAKFWMSANTRTLLLAPFDKFLVPYRGFFLASYAFGMWHISIVTLCCPFSTIFTHFPSPILNSWYVVIQLRVSAAELLYFALCS